ncbi:MAG: 2-oxoglutarate dehydrogenase complex dihydrolipoyllysine-residue succinyltransferase [Gammaproteobacteria bacterium]|nr:2-oxoglutarate dehydrogenase complex dihydrolipoyllysine-residue succinyltransferase [Gammaproteobacteria bacterium]
MTIEVKVPQLPESVADATLISWHKQPGDYVERDENLVDLETDKVVLEVPAPASGVLKEIKIEDGTTVTSGELLAILDEKATAGASDQKKADADDKTAAAAGPEAKASDSGEESADDDGGDDSSAGKLSPSVRRLVEEHGLDVSKMKGSGRGGRLTKADVMAFMEGDKGAGKAAAKSGAKEPKAPAKRPPSGSREERRVPMTRLRNRIAERMVEAQSTAAMLTSFNEADMSEIIALRGKYKESFQKAHGVKLGFMSFFVKAATEALKKFPVVNASVEDGEIIYHDYSDVGIAVSTERGLVVPVLRDADQMSFAEVELGINEYATKAREGSIALEDITGGTFTITNGGVFGSLVSTPILNMPQSAILGMHTIKERPVVINGEIVARPMMYLALTYDHRIVDGKDAVLFLVAIKDSLEEPSRLLLEV